MNRKPEEVSLEIVHRREHRDGCKNTRLCGTTVGTYNLDSGLIWRFHIFALYCSVSILWIYLYTGFALTVYAIFTYSAFPQAEVHGLVESPGALRVTFACIAR